MARIRTIKPAFWGSGTTASLRRDARLVSLGLISMADDDGRFLCSTAAVSGYIFPNDELSPRTVRRWITELVEAGIIHEYEHSGVRYGVFPKWHEHQVINRYTPSVLPEPDIECSPRNAGGKQ